MSCTVNRLLCCPAHPYPAVALFIWYALPARGVIRILSLNRVLAEIDKREIANAGLCQERSAPVKPQTTSGWFAAAQVCTQAFSKNLKGLSADRKVGIASCSISLDQSAFCRGYKCRSVLGVTRI